MATLPSMYREITWKIYLYQGELQQYNINHRDIQQSYNNPYSSISHPNRERHSSTFVRKCPFSVVDLQSFAPLCRPFSVSESLSYGWCIKVLKCLIFKCQSNLFHDWLLSPLCQFVHSSSHTLSTHENFNPKLKATIKDSPLYVCGTWFLVVQFCSISEKCSWRSEGSCQAGECGRLLN